MSIVKSRKLYETDHLQVALSTKSPASGAAEIEARVCILQAWLSKASTRDRGPTDY